MKLYTEEQVIEFTMNMISQYKFGNTNIHNRELLKESLDNKTPIVLPSDDEIEKESFYKSRGEDMDLQYYSSHFFEEGAKWMKEQIINQNK